MWRCFWRGRRPILRQPVRMTMLQFNLWVRLNYRVGDRITVNVIRDGKRLDFPMTLPRRAF